MSIIVDTSFGVRGTAKTSKVNGVFNQRTQIPSLDNPYYISSRYGGYNANSKVVDESTGRVTPNCVGYAWGRYNEILCSKVGNWKGVGGNANQILGEAMKANWPCVSQPTIGALVCWDGQSGCWVHDSRYGHVAVVEDVMSEDWICISESAWGAEPWSTGTSGQGRGKDFAFGWINPKTYGKLQGYVVNEATAYGDFSISTHWLLSEASLSFGGAFSEMDFSNVVWPSLKSKNVVKTAKTYQEVTKTVSRDELRTADSDLNKIKSTNLLSYPSLVETPFITLKIGDYTFGTASKSGDLQKTKLKVTYPDYMKSINITKINGKVNQYTINMAYQIMAGDDPNRLDKIFSSVGYGTVKISYGDWSNPSFIYKEEEALITKLSSSIDFASSSINYTLNCTSSSLTLLGGTFSFPAKYAKPSDVIKEILYDNQYGLLDVFYGMKNKTYAYNLIASDDKQVQIEAKQSMDSLSYINYLVTCMCSESDTGNSVLKTSNYYMTIHDDIYGEEKLEGPYFKITKVTSDTATLATADTYEVDIGYPSDNLVTDFKLVDDNSWALLYNYSDKINNSNYTYKLNDQGVMLTEYSPSIVTTSNTHKMSESQRTWWTQMTQFPVSATLTIKGLVRPAVLMTYIRVNALFYGQRHSSSGLYVISKQQDVIDGKGYRTILSLTRVAGDNDYFEKTTEEVKVKVYN